MQRGEGDRETYGAQSASVFWVIQLIAHFGSTQQHVASLILLGHGDGTNEDMATGQEFMFFLYIFAGFALEMHNSFLLPIDDGLLV